MTLWLALEWWPAIWMSLVFVGAWAALIWIAAKSFTNRDGRGSRR